MPMAHSTIGGDTSLRHQEPRSWIARYRRVSVVIIGDKGTGTYRGCSHADRHARQCWTVARIEIVTPPGGCPKNIEVMLSYAVTYAVTLPNHGGHVLHH